MGDAQHGSYLEVPFGGTVHRVTDPNPAHFTAMVTKLLTMMKEGQWVVVTPTPRDMIMIPPSTPIRIHLEDNLPDDRLLEIWSAARSETRES